MSDCQKIILLPDNDGRRLINVHDANCLTNEDNEFWAKAGFKTRVYSDVLSKYEKRGKLKRETMARVILRMTFEEMMKDMLDLNYEIAMPHILGGRMKAISVDKGPASLNRKKNRITIVDFNKYSKRLQTKFFVINGDKYIAKLFKDLKKGRRYVQE